MTYINISGPEEDLQELDLLCTKFFQENGIQAKTNIHHYRQDSFDAQQIEILGVVFGGVSVVLQLIDIAISVIKKKSTTDNVSFHIKIKTSNGGELDLEISGALTESQIQNYREDTKDLVTKFLTIDDGMSLQRLEAPELAKINSLFKELEAKLTDIRVLAPPKIAGDLLPPKTVGNVLIFPGFKQTNLLEAIRGGMDKTFYLKTDDIEHCKNIFYILEREDILSFHEGTDDRILEIEGASVGFISYKVELLSLFKKIISSKDFVFHERFQTDD
jgi:hypothetical protein